MALNRRAAELGGEHNADTGYEDISLTFEVFNEDLDDALALLAEQYYHTAVDPRRLRKEQRVVMEEIRGRLDDPGERLYRRAWARLFRGALAHPVSGNIASVARIEPADVAGVPAPAAGACQHRARGRRRRLGGDALRAAVRRHFRRGAPGTAATGAGRALGPRRSLRVRDRDSSQAYLTLLMPVQPSPRGPARHRRRGRHRRRRSRQPACSRSCASGSASATRSARISNGGPTGRWPSSAASGARSRADRLVRAVQRHLPARRRGRVRPDELDRARKKLRYRYATLADSRLDQAVALAESALWGFPTPQETERIVAQPVARRGRGGLAPRGARPRRVRDLAVAWQ